MRDKLHYSDKLKNEIYRLKKEKNNCEDMLREISRYLHSSKFSCGDDLDGYVNINDILSRIGLAIDALYSIN